MPWLPKINLAGLVVVLEDLEHRLQNGERSVKLQAETRQIVHTVNKIFSLQQNWRQEINDCVRRIIDICEQQWETPEL